MAYTPVFWGAENESEVRTAWLSIDFYLTLWRWPSSTGSKVRHKNKRKMT